MICHFPKGKGPLICHWYAIFPRENDVIAHGSKEKSPDGDGKRSPWPGGYPPVIQGGKSTTSIVWKKSKLHLLWLDFAMFNDTEGYPSCWLKGSYILGWRHRYVPCHQAQFPAQEGCVPHHFSRELKEMQGPRGEGKVFLQNVCIMWKYLCILPIYYPYITHILPKYVDIQTYIYCKFSCLCRISERLNDSERLGRSSDHFTPHVRISSNQRWFQQHVQPLNGTCFHKCAHVKLKKELEPE